MWQRWSTSTSSGSSVGRRRPIVFAVVMAPHGTGLLNATMMGDALESVSIC